ncbi:uncharacterized protein LTR77_003744 [Saxophila tyrrhenica]|uniref:Uncharacterized protein n=1 Tax=Saxophila tyrrhenica TaxID=1690608 RepID=A0AAV9PHD9_9PEZI|nr:hypothetical protein LTR77_003744 [Saxophila tyrrhenica]
MPFPNSLLPNSTWRHIGLGLTTTVFALGGLALINPPAAGAALGVTPTTPEGREINEKSMIFLGIRDVAVAGAMAWFWREGKDREVGVLLTAWVAVCVTDTWVAQWGKERWDGGIWGLVAGAVVVGLAGAGLVQC